MEGWKARRRAVRAMHVVLGKDDVRGMWETSEAVRQLPVLDAGGHPGALTRTGETGARMLRLRSAAFPP